MLGSAEMRALRSIREVTLRGQIGSSEIQEDLNVQNLVRFARSRHCRNHIDRIGDGRWANGAKDQKPTSKRLPGRPPKKRHETGSFTFQKVYYEQ